MIPTRRWLPIALVIALLGGLSLIRLQQSLDQVLSGYREELQILYLSSGDWIKRLSMGYDGLLACLYWTRAVQHFGRERLAKGEYKLLHPLLDITTTLDPELLLAYRFGAFFLTEKPPGGPGRPDLAIELLQKGIQNNPDYWRFWYDLGFIYYWSLQDYQRAAEAFNEGAKHPEAHEWMRVMAARVAAEGGNRALSRDLWREVYESTDDPNIRANALQHLYGLKVDDDAEFLQALVQRYQERTGQTVKTFQQLVAAGVLRRLPRDPLGYPYRLTSDGRVLLHPESPITTSTLGREE